MNGFLQRMDEKFRNYSFAMMSILGDEPALEIQGVCKHPVPETKRKR